MNLEQGILGIYESLGESLAVIVGSTEKAVPLWDISHPGCQLKIGRDIGEPEVEDQGELCYACFVQRLPTKAWS